MFAAATHTQTPVTRPFGSLWCPPWDWGVATRQKGRWATKKGKRHPPPQVSRTVGEMRPHTHEASHG